MFQRRHVSRWLKETTKINNLVSLTQLTVVTVTGNDLALPSDAPLQLNAEIFVGSISPGCTEEETWHHGFQAPWPTEACRADELAGQVSSGVENLCQATAFWRH